MNTTSTSASDHPQPASSGHLERGARVPGFLVAPWRLPDAFPAWLQASDLQGLAQLATQGALGVTTVAEAVQGKIHKMAAAPFGPLGARFVDPAPEASGIKPGGLTSLFYGGVRGVTRLAGGAVNSALARAARKAAGKPSLRSPLTSQPREAMLAAVNGVLGDHLIETANPLATSMRLCHGGEELLLSRAALAARFPKAGGKILVLVHTLCMNDLQWESPGSDGPHDHGKTLAQEQGYTPVYLRYNSGLHTSVNGAGFAGLLEQLCLAWPETVEDISILAHGMGGLVARSAYHQAEAAPHVWRGKLRKLVFLGTPHHGTPGELLDGWVNDLLRAGVVTRPFARIGHLRSAGMTDLLAGDLRQPTPLPMDVACFAVAAATGSQPLDEGSSLQLQMSSSILGDGLVPLGSALGRHADAGQDLLIEDHRRLVVWQTHHLALLHSVAVLVALRTWFRA